METQQEYLPYNGKESLKRALKKYYEKNKEKIRAYAREYVKNKYQTNPEYREQRRVYSQEYYKKRKDLIKQLTESIPSVESMG